MKQQTIEYLAFGVHQATIVAVARDERGSIILQATIPTEARAIVQLVKSAGPRVHVAFEEGTQAQWLHDLIVPYAEKVVVCNTRGRSNGGNKNDRLDAEGLSERLRLGALKPAFHGVSSMLTLTELVPSYNNLVEDTTRVMQRIKALYRARAIATKGMAVYRASERTEWLAKLNGGSRARASVLFSQLDVLLSLRPPAKAAMLAEARRQAGWKPLRSIPYLGPIRVAQILAIIRRPFRFRTKRNLCPYVGLAVITRSSADKEFVDGRLRKRRRPPMTRGLNRNHNPILKSVLRGAANAATIKPGPLQQFYRDSLARGAREELAKVTLTRKIVSVALRLWKNGELWDPKKLTMQVT
jgi:transposase